MLRIGHFASSPWAPCYAGSEAWPAERVRCVSSGVRALASAGRLDATPMATLDWFEMAEAFPRLGPLGLAYREQARSVLFFANVPLDALGGVPVAISTETTTSVRVLQALLAGKYGLVLGPTVPHSTATPEGMPRLLIQDEALVELARNRFTHVVDLGREWWAWQGTPIVSAVWVHRRDLPAADVARARAMVEASMRRFAADPRTEAAAFCASHTTPLTAPALIDLVGHFRYTLGTEEEAGIERMRSLCTGAPRHDVR